MRVLKIGEDISYREILAHGGIPRALVSRDTFVQFKAPSRDARETEALLGKPLREFELVPRVRWMRGFRRALQFAEKSRGDVAGFSVERDDIMAMFNKLECHGRFLRAGVPAPRFFMGARSFDALPHGRLFLKPVYGSSAAGIVALQCNASRVQARTTVDLADGSLFNTRRIRVMNDRAEIERLVNALCNYDWMFAEQWVPKASIDGKVFDVRVVMRDGKVEKRVARLSNTPLTNLHLLNERRDASFISDDAWQQAEATCLRAMACFPSAQSAGIDLAFTPRYASHVIFEVNAFGDTIHEVAT